MSGPVEPELARRFEGAVIEEMWVYKPGTGQGALCLAFRTAGRVVFLDGCFLKSFKL